MSTVDTEEGTAEGGEKARRLIGWEKQEAAVMAASVAGDSSDDDDDGSAMTRVEERRSVVSGLLRRIGCWRRSDIMVDRYCCCGSCLPLLLERFVLDFILKDH